MNRVAKDGSVEGFKFEAKGEQDAEIK